MDAAGFQSLAVHLRTAGTLGLLQQSSALRPSGPPQIQSGLKVSSSHDVGLCAFLHMPRTILVGSAKWDDPSPTVSNHCPVFQCSAAGQLIGNVEKPPYIALSNPQGVAQHHEDHS